MIRWRGSVTIRKSSFKRPSRKNCLDRDVPETDLCTIKSHLLLKWCDQLFCQEMRWNQKAFTKGLQSDLFIAWFCIFTSRDTRREQFKNKEDNGFLPPGPSVHTWVPHTWLWDRRSQNLNLQRAQKMMWRDDLGANWTRAWVCKWFDVILKDEIKELEFLSSWTFLAS